MAIFFASCIFSKLHTFHSKFALRPHHVRKYGRHPICNCSKYARKKRRKKIVTAAVKQNVCICYAGRPEICSVSVWEKGREIEFTNFDKSTIFQQPDNTVLVTTDTPSHGSDVWLVLGKLLMKINVYQGLKFETSVTSSSSSVSHSHPLESPLSDSSLSSSSEAESKSDVYTHTHCTVQCSRHYLTTLIRV